MELGPAAKVVAADGFTVAPCLPAPSIPTSTVPADDGTDSGAAAEAENRDQNTKKRKLDQLALPVDRLTSTGRSPLAQQHIRSLLYEGVDHLIIACKYRPLPLLKVALYLLAPSAAFVVYHEFLEPLIDCYLYLQQHQLALRLNLSDTWTREFQTLPGRMRPEMFMSTSGGFLLTGVYIGMLPRPFLQDESNEEVNNSAAGDNDSSNSYNSST